MAARLEKPITKFSSDSKPNSASTNRNQMKPESENWYFKVRSEDYGAEEFGPYESEADAEAGIKRVQAKAKALNDGVERWYGEPYENSFEE